MQIMADVAKLIEGFSSLLWPVIVLVVIYLFKPAVAGIIESGKSRKFSLKLGGQELTMEEVSQQQRNLIADLQAQVVELREKVEGVSPVVSTMTATNVKALPERSRSILWVDDNPKNNSLFIQQLSDRGVTVDLALSTSDGLSRFDRGRYNLIISDMGRTEDGSYIATAGLDFLKIIRQKNQGIPFVIFCSSRGVREHREEAKALGVTAITSSPTELFGVLSNELGELRA